MEVVVMVVVVMVEVLLTSGARKSFKRHLFFNIPIIFLLGQLKLFF